MRFHSFPLDHFGCVASPLLQGLLNQSSNKRTRKTHFNALVHMAKATKQVPKDQLVVAVGLVCDLGGQLTIEFFTDEEKKSA